MVRRIVKAGIIGYPLALFFFWALVAEAAQPVFMPGFPMRAGTVAIVMWAPVPGANEYRVMKKVGDEAFKEVYRGPMNNYSDPAAPPDKTITYQIIAVIGGKDSDPSKEGVLAGVKPLDAPDITGILPDPGGLRVRWTVVSGAAFYNLYRADAQSGPYKLVTSLQEPQYFDRDPKVGKTVYYQVSAVDKMNTESQKSKPSPGKIEEVVTVSAVKPVFKGIPRKGEYRGQQNFELEKPVWIAVDGKGELIVVEGHGLQILDKEGTFLRRVQPEQGWGPPHAAFLDGKDHLYVTFSASEKIRKFDLEGKLIQELTIPPPPKAPEKKPIGASLSLDGEGNIWVGDYESGQIVVLDPAGKEAGRIGNIKGAKEPQKDTVTIAVPGRIAFSAKRGEMWVVDTLNAVIHIFEAKTRNFVKTVGGRKNRDGTDFQGIAGIAFKDDGNVLVLDNMLGVVKELDPDLKYLLTYVDPETKEKNKLQINYPSSFYYHPRNQSIYVSSMLLGTCWEYPLGGK